MVLATLLHWTGGLDWTGVGTLALAIATVGLAWITRRSVGDTEAELEQSQRPVLVPYTDRSNGDGNYVKRTGPHYLVPIENVGLGPALNIILELDVGDPVARQSPAGQVVGEYRLTVLAAREHSARMLVEISGGDLMGFALNMRYESVAGKRYATTARYDASRDRFDDVALVVGELSEDKRAKLTGGAFNPLV